MPTGADTKTGYLFCSECDDFIYDMKLDEMHLAAIVSAEEKQTRFRGTCLIPKRSYLLRDLLNCSVSKKPREMFKPWVPSPREASALEGAELIPCQGMIAKFTWSLSLLIAQFL
jgi:ubiquitin carboxyl-terminal hydrolase 22/27/51